MLNCCETENWMSQISKFTVMMDHSTVHPIIEGEGSCDLNNTRYNINKNGKVWQGHIQCWCSDISNRINAIDCNWLRNIPTLHSFLKFLIEELGILIKELLIQYTCIYIMFIYFVVSTKNWFYWKWPVELNSTASRVPAHFSYCTWSTVK